MWYNPYIIVLLLWTVNGAPIPPCPDGCTCKILDDSRQDLTCNTLNFIGNVEKSYLSSIVSLHLRNLNITKIDNRLNELNELLELDLAHNLISNIRNIPILPKLKSLNLNNNFIKDVTADYLPRTLNNIDISNNKINYIPKSFLELRELKSLYLKNNPISCTCDTIVVLDKLTTSGVVFPDRIECYSPQEHQGKTWQDVHCETTENDLRDDMIGDIFESSGEVDSEKTTLVDNEDDDEKDYLPVDNKLLENNENDEGSGDSDMHFPVAESTTETEFEGSGVEEIIVPPKHKEQLYHNAKACYFNCSTPKPLESNSTAKPPDFIDSVQILYHDVSGQTTLKPKVIEETTVKVIPSTTGKSDSNLDDVDIIDEGLKNATNTRGLERQLEEPNTKMSTTFMIVVGLLALMICLVVYSVYKRRQLSKRRRTTNNIEPEGKELMPITKPSTEPIKEKVPLLNGQNGTNNTKTNENDNIPDNVDYKHQNPPYENGDKYIDDNDDDYRNQNDDGDLQLRNKDSDNLLTPKMERVTIQERELSAPKTPILVNRQFNDDGSITTTPTN